MIMEYINVIMGNILRCRSEVGQETEEREERQAASKS